MTLKIRLKCKLNELLFMTALFFYYFGAIYAQTEINIDFLDSIVNLFQYASMGILVLKIIIDGTYNINNLCKWASFFILIFLVSIFSHKYSLILPIAMFIFAGSNINPKKIIKLCFYILSVFMTIIIIMSLIGIIDNTTVGDDSRIRYCLGFKYTTYAPNFFFHLVLMYVYIKDRSLSFFESLFVFAINFILYYYTNTRAVFYTVNIFIIFCWLIKPFHNIQRNRLFELISYSFIFCFIFAVVLQYYYDPSIEWMKSLNKMLSNRLYYGNSALLNYPINLFGNDITFNSFGSSGDIYNFVDSAYVNVLIQYGLVTVFSLVFGFTIMLKNHVSNNNKYCSIALFFFAIHCITDPQLLSIICNPWLYILGSYLIGREKHSKSVYSKNNKLYDGDTLSLEKCVK